MTIPVRVTSYHWERTHTMSNLGCCRDAYHGSIVTRNTTDCPLQPVGPTSPDFILGPENPQTPPVPQEEDEREPWERLARCMAPPAHSPPLPPSSGCLNPNPDTQDSSTQALIDAVTVALHPPSLPPTPQLYTYHHSIDRRRMILPESEQPPRKRLHLSSICTQYETSERVPLLTC
ncbi:hypothetical protein Tco_1103929 [Tanacetum coccineum]